MTGNEAAGRKPRIGITIGDPAGIGPEVSLKVAADAEVLAACVPVLIGDARYLSHWSRIFGVACDYEIVRAGEPLPNTCHSPVIYDLANIPDIIEMGREQAACGRCAGEFIETAVRLCLTGEIDAVTTAPLNKKSLHLGGYLFPGHTEFLAALTNTDDFAMSFISPALRVALLTTHVALTEVAGYVKKATLEKLIRLVHREFVRYGIERPRIAVAALNPHGGEGMLFGVEEASEMLPAIEACRTEDGIEVSGPHSGDTIFLRASRGEFDIVLSCYHDQGLIPVKCLSFGEAVNVTLGLPFIRTSVDHGTAFDIAGQGKANHSSMIAAVKLAVDLFQARSKRRK
ncbi:MAG TPA: 4-hydroxythreonine-4-phosphate dehydrogenase PdxA [Blastocatellia bacterium]|nr:4-hydroxythreonine-4-phosphate dehydrogenase PdxA [Blastocatellia bacterium]HMV81964.1 4-hydroxythreonine-4-phosphate dehydrogenase PdxA [Blastocatellia bacterium]HMX25803.1 4-hydroxythreonine-4-phosphate dehydrogenase PdxA [Blastocatellia bacterium]HMY70480.1 4-hydroxythreonine-4-phosphate dehydrogenase PdxA [Blastocatellia bacterium]HMZ16342.1 4-hydroxythreonine-4-phosphate dehydrogenase PdxA [Blastocatellia bacterium]